MAFIARLLWIRLQAATTGFVPRFELECRSLVACGPGRAGRGIRARSQAPDSPAKTPSRKGDRPPGDEARRAVKVGRRVETSG